MCTPVSLVGSTTCVPGIGGAGKAYVCKFSEITAWTVASGKITGVTMSSTGLWMLWEPNQNSTARLDFPGADPTKNVFFYNSEGYLEYPWSEEAAVKTNTMIPCCDLVLVWFLFNGITVFQGVQFNSAGTGVEKAVEPAKYVPSFASGSGDTEAKCTILIKSKAKNQAIALASTITPAYIAAL